MHDQLWPDSAEMSFIEAYHKRIKELEKLSCMWCAKYFFDEETLEAHEAECR